MVDEANDRLWGHKQTFPGLGAISALTLGADAHLRVYVMVPHPEERAAARVPKEEVMIGPASSFETPRGPTDVPRE